MLSLLEIFDKTNQPKIPNSTSPKNATFKWWRAYTKTRKDSLSRHAVQTIASQTALRCSCKPSTSWMWHERVGRQRAFHVSSRPIRRSTFHRWSWCGSTVTFQRFTSFYGFQGHRRKELLRSLRSHPRSPSPTRKQQQIEADPRKRDASFNDQLEKQRQSERQKTNSKGSRWTAAIPSSCRHAGKN